MLGEVVRDVPAAAERAAAGARVLGARPRLTVRGLAAGTKLQDVSFELYPGEVLGVVALEGQGQDELFDILAGSDRPSGGELLVDGAPVSFRHPADAIRAGLVYVPADRAEALLMQRSVRENIASRSSRGCAIGARSTRVTSAGRSRAGSRDCRSTRVRRARCGGSPAATSRR